MKLKVPINKKDPLAICSWLTSGRESDTWIDGYNTCLNDVSQLEVSWDELALAQWLYVNLFEQNLIMWGAADKYYEIKSIKLAKSIIASLPEIITIKKGS